MLAWSRATLSYFHLHLHLRLATPISPVHKLPLLAFPANLKVSLRNNFLASNLKQCEGARKAFDGRQIEDPYLEGQALRLTATSMDKPPSDYRPNVGICLLNSNNQVFVASRLDVPGAWQMPQGGVDECEDPRAAAIRELREETGVVSAQIIAEVPYWLTYDFPPAIKEKISHLWGGEWKGQAQKWFLLRFTGDEEEINLAGDGREAAEFSEWKWMPAEQVIEQAVDFKRPVYEQVFRFFSPYLESKSDVL